MAKPPRDEASDTRVFGRRSREEKADDEFAFAALGPIVSGLMLESYFEVEVLTEKGLRRVLGRVFDALFPSGR